MGDLHHLYCKRHMETMNLGKFGPGFQVRWGRLPEDAVAVLREIQGKRSNRTPSEIEGDERLLDLISEFLRRHCNCEVHLILDADPQYVGIFGVWSVGWKRFSVSSDSKYMESRESGDAEQRERYKGQLMSSGRVDEVKRIEDAEIYVRDRRRKMWSNAPEVFLPDEELVNVHAFRQIDQLTTELVAASSEQRPRIQEQLRYWQDEYANTGRAIQERRLWEGEASGYRRLDLVELIRTRPLYDGPIHA